MDPGAFAGFLAATGHRVVRSDSAYWYTAGPAFFLSVPSHRLLCPDATELGSVLRRQPCIGVRFPAPLDGPGKLSYQIVCDDRDYGLGRLSANVRSKVRRGLKRCEVTPVACSEVALRGRQADLDTVARQGRPTRHGGRGWERFWRAAGETTGMEAWAAWAGGEMAAFLLTVLLDDCVEFLLARSRDDRLDAYPNNALVFCVAEEMLVRRGLRQITFGLESLESVGPLDQFKYGMGFERGALRQRVVFHPVVRRLLAREKVRRWVQRTAESRERGSSFWRKVAGLLRFAEDGGDVGGAGNSAGAGGGAVEWG